MGSLSVLIDGTTYHTHFYLAVVHFCLICTDMAQTPQNGKQCCGCISAIWWWWLMAFQDFSFPASHSLWQFLCMKTLFYLLNKYKCANKGANKNMLCISETSYANVIIHGFICLSEFLSTVLLLKFPTGWKQRHF